MAIFPALFLACCRRASSPWGSEEISRNLCRAQSHDCCQDGIEEHAPMSDVNVQIKIDLRERHGPATQGSLL
jgi:hypothetical protein